MNTLELVEWQIIDHDNGLVMPWLTHPFLAWAKHQDWSDKTIVMFGAGLGDAWLAKKCKKLIVVERNLDWLNKARTYSDANSGMVQYEFRPCNDSDGAADFYLNIDGFNADIIINDDAYRTECCQMAVDYFKGKGGLLIADNWVQSFVWMSPKAEEIMKPYKAMIFEQADHKDNDGVNKWKTAAWNIPS
jgi:hypothetical protein